MSTKVTASQRALSISEESWFYATTFGDTLCLRYSSLVELAEDYPEVIEYLSTHRFKEQSHYREADDYMIGHAVVSIFVKA